MRSTRILAACAAFALAIAGCTSGGANPGTDSTTAPADKMTETPSEKPALAFEEIWVKAAEEGMTAVFGYIHNTTDADVHVVGVSSEVSAKAEIHETVEKDGQMMMQEMSDGFVVKAGETKELKPGGDHLMLLGLKKAIEPGDDVIVSVATEGGENFTLKAVARSFDGAKEQYGVHGEDKNDKKDDEN